MSPLLLLFQGGPFSLKRANLLSLHPRRVETRRVPEEHRSNIVIPSFARIFLRGGLDWSPTTRPSHPPYPAHAKTCADPGEHRQTELVRPGANLIDLGDGIPPILLVRVRRAKEINQPIRHSVSGVPPSASTRGERATLPLSYTGRGAWTDGLVSDRTRSLQLTDPKSNFFSHFRSIVSLMR